MPDGITATALALKSLVDHSNVLIQLLMQPCEAWLGLTPFLVGVYPVTEN